jgi:hypothetical protein
MEGRKKLKLAAATSEDSKIPCVKEGVEIILDNKVPTVKKVLKGTGKEFKTCQNFVSKNLFDKSQVCEKKPCSFDG